MSLVEANLRESLIATFSADMKLEDYIIASDFWTAAWKVGHTEL